MVRELTPSQLKIVKLVSEGYFNKEIASRTGIGYQAVKNIVRDANIRLGTRNRVEMAIWYLKRYIYVKDF